MAPTEEKNQQQRAQDVTNPFIAFRRFADDQMSNLMNGIFGLSTSASDRKSQDYRAWLQEARASRQSLEREQDEAGRIMDLYMKAYDDSAKEEDPNAMLDRDQSLRCPYRPDNQELPKCPYRPDDPELQHRPDRDSDVLLANLGIQSPQAIFASSVLGGHLYSVPIGFLLSSPYSPIQLEHHQALRERGIDWREAFEDLLAVQNGQDITSGRSRDESSTGADWVKNTTDSATELGLPFHRFLNVLRRNPDLLAHFTREEQPASDATEQEEPQTQEDDDQMTELDLYNHFLGAQENSTSDEASSESHSQSLSRSFAHIQQDPAPTKEGSNKPSILSTLTTTERTTLGDGTVHTKVVLKKRFSDGREESSETMHTQNPVPKPVYQSPTGADEQERSQEIPDSTGKERKNTGWFWS